MPQMILDIFAEESRHLKGAGNMSSIQFIDTETEITEGGIINRKDFFLNKTQLSSIKAAEECAVKRDLKVANLSACAGESWEVTGCIDGNMEDDMEVTA